MAYLSMSDSEFINEEKLIKILEVYLPKCPTFNIIYKLEDLEYYKTLDPNGSIVNIEDILKLEDNLFVNIF